MKKVFSVLLVLCLLCTAAAAFADAVEEKIPAMSELPALKTDPENGVQESDYQGEWVMKYAYIGSEPATQEQLAELGVQIINHLLTVHEGQLIDSYTNDKGELEEFKIPYVFDDFSGQITAEYEEFKMVYTLDLLEDNNIMMSLIFLGDEEAEPKSASLYMVRPEV